jgi:hypothetical protein
METYFTDYSFPKNGIARATSINNLAIDDQPLTRFDINENVDYSRQVIVDCINNILKNQGVATVYLDWQVDLIYSIFNAVFLEPVISIESYFGKNRKRADYYAIRKTRNITKDEISLLRKQMHKQLKRRDMNGKMRDVC